MRWKSDKLTLKFSKRKLVPKPAVDDEIRLLVHGGAMSEHKQHTRNSTW